MKAIGKVLEVTNLDRFIATYLADPANPDPTTFRPVSDARIHIGSVLPVPGFFPSLTVKVETDSTGMFELDCSHLSSALPAYLVAYRQLQAVNVLGMTVPIFGPVYRSESFRLSSIDDHQKNIYVVYKELPNDQGISQAQITAQVNHAKGNIANVDSLSAFITENGIDVVGKGKGATIKFRITLSPSTSHHLDQFVTHKIEDFDVDLPGWDWLTSLCVSEDDIEKEVRTGVRSILITANQQIRQNIVRGIAQASGLNDTLITSLFDTSLSLTFSKIRYPVVETRKLGFVTIKLRAIVPDPCLGLPRRLYS